MEFHKKDIYYLNYDKNNKLQHRISFMLKSDLLQTDKHSIKI
jgi:hypothetical protein